MGALFTWFTALSTGAKVGIISGASVVGLGAASAIVEPPTEPTPQSVVEEVKQDQPQAEVREEFTTENIPFKTISQDDFGSPVGTETITQEGQDGVRSITYQVAYIDGKEISRKEVSSIIKAEPRNKIVTVGRYIAPPAPAPTPSTCDSNYSGGCVPIVSYDLDCPDIGFSVVVVGSDPHGFDGNDNDGLGCESY
jgi:hypothetical protein